MKRMLVLMLLCVLPVVVGAEEQAPEAGATEVASVTGESGAATPAEEPLEVGAAEAETDSGEVEAAAAGDDDSRIYVIKKGDTLWGISQRFIKDPEYWPSLWANNPFVTNPHLIYPGQKIKFHDGRIEIVPASSDEEIEEVIGEQEGVVAEQAEMEAIPETLPEPEDQIEIRVAGGEGFIARDELESVGTLVDTVDSRYMMVAGDTVFVTFDELGAVRPGDRFNVVRSAGPVLHPRNGSYLGERISEKGIIEVREVHADVATAEIIESESEIQRGDRLLMHSDPRVVVPLKKAPRELEGVVADARMNKLALGENDFIYTDLGSEAGLEKGNMLYIARERRATELSAAKNARLPDRLMGAAVVVDVRPTTSVALVLKSVDAIRRGDKVITQTD